MKKVLSTLLIVVLLLGNICYAQNVTMDIDHNTYYAVANTQQYESPGLHNPQEYRHDRDDRHRRHNRHHRHYRHHDNDDDIDAGDIVAGILVYEIVKEIVDD